MTKAIEGFPFAEYQAIRGLNPSTIKIGAHKSMKHLRWALDHPSTVATDAMVIGQLCHSAVLEPDDMDERFVVFDGRRDKRTTVYKEALEEAGDKQIVRTGDLEAAVTMGLAVASDPIVKPLIASGKAEVSLITEEEGVPCKGRLDWVCSEQGFCDLKTCRDITAFAFGSAFYKYGYDISLGLYQRWLSRLRGQPEPCHVLCVEKEPPYDVAVVPVPEAVLVRGVEKAMEVIRSYKTCLERDEWPGIAKGQEYHLHVPHWAMGDDDVDWS